LSVSEQTVEIVCRWGAASYNPGNPQWFRGFTKWAYGRPQPWAAMEGFFHGQLRGDNLNQLAGPNRANKGVDDLFVTAEAGDDLDFLAVISPGCHPYLLGTALLVNDEDVGLTGGIHPNGRSGQDEGR